MDAFSAVNHLAMRVQAIQLSTRQYLANVPRNPLHLTAYLTNTRDLLQDLNDYVYNKVPDDVFAQHWRSTKHLEEQLLALEGGFLRDAQFVRPPDQVQRIKMTEETLREMVEMRFTDKEIAGLHSCSTKTVYRKRRKLGLQKQVREHTTPDDELRNLIVSWWESTDPRRIGSKMTLGWLRSQKIPCTRQQVRNVMRDLQADNHLARRMTVIPRKPYTSPFPNALWHVDGNHKLSRYKFVIHGGIDGFSRLITFMAVGDNNRASTVRRHFIGGAQRFGWPSRVRADYGGENLGVRDAMEVTRGLNRGSFIPGSSPRNQRIERLWRDVRNGFIRKYDETSRELEALGALDVQNALHLYCLHYTFLPMIQHSIDQWAQAWNNHGISGKRGPGNKSPLRHFHLSRALAEQSGYHLDLFPYGRGEAEGSDWYTNMRRAHNVDLAQYELYQNGRGQERDPLPGDQHAIVDRFADDLPQELYADGFLDALRTEFPLHDGMSYEQGKRLYVGCLDYVERYVDEWYREA